LARRIGSLSEPHSLKEDHAQLPAGSSVFNDYYFMGLGVLLAGYAIGSKTFAYISIPPLYIGDIVLAFGIIAFLKSKCAAATLAAVPSLLLALLFSWAIIVGALPTFSTFGINTLRDSAIVAYGGFAFIFVALLLERPERLPRIIRFLCVLSSIVMLTTPIVMALLMISEAEPYIQIKIGTLGAHLAGAALLMLLGFRRPSIGWFIVLFIGIVLVTMRTRGGLLAFVIPLALALIVTGKWRESILIGASAAGIFGLAYMLDLSISVGHSFASRDISAKQLVENFTSIFGATAIGSGGSSGLEGTRAWRLEWWNVIFDYTFNGPYFWTGKGFGINLADADGFITVEGSRSPHNCFIAILARTGVPGLALWLLTLGSWSAMLFVNMVRARLAGEQLWADVFLLIFCYALALIIDGTFDAALEGPVSSIWFWSLFGVGIGATMIYRATRSIDQKSVWQATTQLERVLIN
jgi:O-Antigen ligase